MKFNKKNLKRPILPRRPILPHPLYIFLVFYPEKTPFPEFMPILGYA